MKKVIKKAIKNKDSETKAELVRSIPDTDKSVIAYPMLVKRLRDVTLLVRGGDTWIRLVSDAHLISIYEYLQGGMHSEVVVEKARSWGYFVNPSNKSDVAAVTLFKKQVIRGTIHELDPQTQDEKEIRKGFQSRVMRLMQEVDPIALLVETVKIQRERVMMGHDIEVADEKINPMLSAEITTLNRMTSDLIDKFQRLGIMPEKPIEHVVTLNKEFNNVLDVLDTGGQNRMLTIAEKFLKSIPSAVVEMEVNDDGTFSVPDAQ